MSSINPDPCGEHGAQELAYYRRILDDLGAERLRLEYAVSEARHEIKQKRQALALLAVLQGEIGAENDVHAILVKSVGAVNAMLGMDRTILLTPTDVDEFYRIDHTRGFPGDDGLQICGRRIHIPWDFRAGDGVLTVTSSMPRGDVSAEISTLLGLATYIAVPVVGEREVIGVILSGRIREARPLYPGIDQGDIDTFKALAGFISTTVKNMRIVILERLDRLKADVFANISHEFRTPITLTLGPIQGMLAGRYGDLDAEIRSQLRMMMRSQEQLLALINQILDLARLEAGFVSMRMQRIANMNDFIAQACAPFASAAEVKGIEFRLNLGRAIDDVDVYVDREKIGRVLSNLLSNALKFTQRGSIEVETGLAGERLSIQIRDTGVGIRPEHLQGIFERFRQADESVSRDFGGSGIGLSLVRELVRLHNGEISVRSEFGRGTSFEVTLLTGRSHLAPESIVEASESDDVVLPPNNSCGSRSLDQSPPSDREIGQGLSSDRAKVLYADDNADLREYVYSLLSPAYEVLVAVDGEDAFAKALLHRPDVILSDVMMPRLGGAELCRRVRANGELKATRLILLTAKSSIEAKVGGLEVGADDYMTKPFSEAELLARIKNMVRLRQQEDALQKTNVALEAANRELQALSTRDALTGLFNRRYFDKQLSDECQILARSGGALSIFMIDVDHFKLYNDRYGHTEGDGCLKFVSNVIASAFARGSDFAARYGGEEFVVVAVGMTPSEAADHANALCERVAERCFAHAGSPFGIVTVSVGHCTSVIVPTTKPVDLIDRADAALYEAKRSGRNRAAASAR